MIVSDVFKKEDSKCSLISSKWGIIFIAWLKNLGLYFQNFRTFYFLKLTLTPSFLKCCYFHFKMP